MAKRLLSPFCQKATLKRNRLLMGGNSPAGPGGGIDNASPPPRPDPGEGLFFSSKKALVPKGKRVSVRQPAADGGGGGPGGRGAHVGELLAALLLEVIHAAHHDDLGLPCAVAEGGGSPGQPIHCSQKAINWPQQRGDPPQIGGKIPLALRDGGVTGLGILFPKMTSAEIFGRFLWLQKLFQPEAGQNFFTGWG